MVYEVAPAHFECNSRLALGMKTSQLPYNSHNCSASTASLADQLQVKSAQSLSNITNLENTPRLQPCVTCSHDITPEAKALACMRNIFIDDIIKASPPRSVQSIKPVFRASFRIAFLYLLG